MKSDSLLYPAPPPNFHYLDIDDYLINGRKKRKTKRQLRQPKRPLKQLEFNFNINVNQEPCHTKTKPQ